MSDLVVLHPGERDMILRAAIDAVHSTVVRFVSDPDPTRAAVYAKYAAQAVVDASLAAIERLTDGSEQSEQPSYASLTASELAAIARKRLPPEAFRPEPVTKEHS